MGEEWTVGEWVEGSDPTSIQAQSGSIKLENCVWKRNLC